MKKIVIILAILIAFLVYKTKKEETIIPIESIRIRIIANSNSVEDQNTKLQIKNVVEKELYKLTENSKNIEETRRIINDNIYNSFDNNLNDTLYNIEKNIINGKYQHTDENLVLS